MLWFCVQFYTNLLDGIAILLGDCFPIVSKLPCFDSYTDKGTSHTAVPTSIKRKQVYSTASRLYCMDAIDVMYVECVSLSIAVLYWITLSQVSM